MEEIGVTQGWTKFQARLIAGQMRECACKMDALGDMLWRLPPEDFRGLNELRNRLFFELPRVMAPADYAACLAKLTELEVDNRDGEPQTFIDSLCRNYRIAFDLPTQD